MLPLRGLVGLRPLARHDGRARLPLGRRVLRLQRNKTRLVGGGLPRGGLRGRRRRAVRGAARGRRRRLDLRLRDAQRLCVGERLAERRARSAAALLPERGAARGRDGRVRRGRVDPRTGAVPAVRVLRARRIPGRPPRVLRDASRGRRGESRHRRGARRGYSEGTTERTKIDGRRRASLEPLRAVLRARGRPRNIHVAPRGVAAIRLAKIVGPHRPASSSSAAGRERSVPARRSSRACSSRSAGCLYKESPGR